MGPQTMRGSVEKSRGTQTKGLASIAIASGSASSVRCSAPTDVPEWESWLAAQGIAIESRKTWKYGAEALYFRDPDGHLLEVVSPGVWSIY